MYCSWYDLPGLCEPVLLSMSKSSCTKRIAKRTTKVDHKSTPKESSKDNAQIDQFPMMGTSLFFLLLLVVVAASAGFGKFIWEILYSKVKLDAILQERESIPTRL